MVIPAKRTSFLENAGIGVTYSVLTLMNRIIEKSIAMARSPWTRFGSEYSSD
jgi:hypothetical protein